MQRKRFPLRRYLRLIADIEQEFAWWQREYQGYDQRDESMAVRARQEERGYILELVRPQLHNIFHELERMPRLS